MNINIVCVGKIKEKAYVIAMGEYIKRLGAYCKLSVKELPDQDFKGDTAKTISTEGKQILSACLSKYPNLIMDVKSNMYTSEEFSSVIENYKDKNSGVNIIIGGSYGLSDEVKKSGKTMSFSKMTFPHQLFRVILLEQIYRGFRIINNEPYHK